MDGSNLAKKRIAQYTLAVLEQKYQNNIKTIGLGSGTTVRYFIEALSGSKLAECDLVSSSTDTTMLCNTLGLKVIDILSADTHIDVYVDGADAVFADQKACIKGRGGAMLREKLLAYAAKEFYVLVEQSKLDKKHAIPIEVVPFALNFVFEKLQETKLNPVLRIADQKLGPLVTDNNNFIIDLHPNEHYYEHLLELHESIMKMPGIIDTGIFHRDMMVITIINEQEKIIEI